MLFIKKDILFGSLVLTSCFLSTASFATQAINLRDKPLAVLAQTNTERISLKDALNSLAITYKELNRRIDHNQTTHIRLQQYVGNMPVLGADFVMHIPASEKRFAEKPFAFLSKLHESTMNGIIYSDFSDLKTSIIFNDERKTKALNEAIRLSKFNKNDIQDIQNHLVIYPDKKDGTHFVYAINFVVNNQSTFVKPSYLLDAITFKPYQKWNGVRPLEDVLAGGRGGNGRLGEILYDFTTSFTPGFTVKREPLLNTCYLRNDRIVLRDVKNDLEPVEFSCPTPIAKFNHLYWNKGEYVNDDYSPENNIYFAANVTVKMFEDWYQTPVWVDSSGKPKSIPIWVNDQRPFTWCFGACNWKQYAGTIDDKYIRIGNGDDEYLPFTTLDLVAHEIAHGFTYEHAKFSDDFRNTEAEAIDEAFSDMTAKAVEDYLYHANPNWNIGPVFRDKERWLRYMDHPAQDCKWSKSEHSCSIEDISKMTRVTDDRFASGIFNRAFYLMATASGSSTRKSYDVMVQANRHYWTSNTTFCEAAKGVVQAAVDEKLNVKIVKDAFIAVGIDVDTCTNKGEENA